MAVAEEAVSVRLRSVIIIQADRVHHAQKISVVGNSDERSEKEKAEQQAEARRHSHNMRFNP
ncbi:hypothetical protein D3C76_1609010 [compost metagenome]